MKRLYVLAEGLTEVQFVHAVLRPHLEEHFPSDVSVHGPLLGGVTTHMHV